MSANNQNLRQNECNPYIASEIEFVADEQLIEIYPAFNHDQTSMSIDGGEYGPFDMHTPCSVPIYMAYILKKAKQCRIIQPSWFTVANLTQIFQQETQDPESLQPLPFHYLEIGNFLLTHARDDLDRPERLRECLKDLEDVRQAKLTNSLQALRHNRDAVSLTGATLMELQPLRSALAKLLNSVGEVDNLRKQQ